MPEYLDDPSVLTKEKLRSELLAHSVELPGGNPTKDVFVQLYLQNLTARNQNRAAAVDAFSSDEELPAAGRSRSSGRKSTRKTEKASPEDLDVAAFTDEGLRAELLRRGVGVGPVVASTRQLYEKKLQQLLDTGAEPPPPVQVHHNGGGEPGAELGVYSDTEDEVRAEPVPVVERPLRSRGKTPVSTRTHSSQHQQVEKITASEQALQVEVQPEPPPPHRTPPKGLTATCRRPIRGAAGRPVVYADLWGDGLRSPKPASSFSSTESPVVHRVSTPAPSSSVAPASSRPLAEAPPAGQTKPARGGVSVWMKLSLLCVVAAFLFLVYQAMETNSIGPFGSQDVAGGGTA